MTELKSKVRETLMAWDHRKDFDALCRQVEICLNDRYDMDKILMRLSDFDNMAEEKIDDIEQLVIVVHDLIRNTIDDEKTC